MLALIEAYRPPEEATAGGARETESRYPARRWCFVELIRQVPRGSELGTETLRAVLMISPRYLLLSMPVWAAGFKNLMAPISHSPRLGRTALDRTI